MRLLARRRGLSLTQAVRQAVRSELDKDELSEEEKARRVAESQRWLAEFYERHNIKPAEKTMTKEEMDDIIGYDENGMW
ncbi:Rv0623-like transcription factor [compost metagenome]